VLVRANLGGESLGTGCWVCLIFFAQLALVFSMLCRACGGSGAVAPRNFFCLGKHIAFFASFSCHLNFHVHCWAVFRHIVFADGFLFLVKELGLLTNPGHWVKVPICILYCKQCITMNEYRICWFSWFGFPGEKSV
jgi:hypothetical protein